MRACKKCLIPENYPGAVLDKSNICNFCNNYTKINLSELEKMRLQREKDLERALKGCRGKGDYDCLVLLSGGKDSAYLLHKLKVEYNLRVLAFTCDPGGYMSDVTMANIETTVKKLNIDHIMYTPPRDFVKKLWSFLLKNQTTRGAVKTVCYTCYPLIQGFALKKAISSGIPLVLEGCAPGQPDPDVMVYEMPERHIKEDSWLPEKVRESGLFTEEELSYFWNPKRYPEGTAFPRILAPFHAWKYSQEEVMKRVVELGLVPRRKYANPVHSNCILNWLMMYSDMKNLGYNSYLFEFASLIREGKASKGEWRMKGRLVKFMLRHKVLLGRYVSFMLRELNLKPEDLQIGVEDEKRITSHHK